jgi:hypothetical protein
LNSKDKNTEVSIQNNMCKINEGFEIGFTNKISIDDEHFAENIFQMEISFWVDWVLCI